MSDEEIADYKAEKEKELNSGFARWSWFAMIEKLAKGDITKFDEIYKINWILALNLLSFWKEREVEINRMNKIQNDRK